MRALVGLSRQLILTVLFLVFSSLLAENAFAACKPDDHCYVMLEQLDVNDAHGVGGLFTEPNPEDQLDAWPWDSTKYSIGQLALISKQLNVGRAIEFGWIVSPTLYEDFEPHLFIALRFNPTKGTCYVGIPACPPSQPTCDSPNPKCSDQSPSPYVQLSPNFPVTQNNELGNSVGKTGEPKIYHVGYYGENGCDGDKGWWIQYGNEWIGCVKEDWFRLGFFGFANGNSIKWYGEVAYGTDLCVPMGNGKSGKTDPDAASISNMFYERMHGNQSIAFDAEATLSKDAPTDTRYWDYGNFSRSGNITNPKGFNGFRYGGGGACDVAR